MPTWIEHVQEATKESESPPKYFVWSALTTLSAILKHNVFLDRGGLYTLYPNIFTVLLGPSGIKKGVPVNLAKKLVEEVDNTRILSGRITIQKAISVLSQGYTRQGKDMIKDASAFFVASEFASFIVRDPEALTILTDLYDTQYHVSGWTSYTKKDDKEKLINPCITMLGAANEVHFKEAVPMNALGGGFIARTFLIHATEGGKRNSLTEKKAPIDIKGLASYLKELTLLKGEFQWSKEGSELYDKWYDEFADEEKKDETGTVNRITDSVLKVAMLASVSRSTDMILHYEDIKYAIGICAETLAGVRKITMGSGKSALAPQVSIVIRFLLNKEDFSASRQEILERNWGNFDTFELDRIIETLSQMKAINLHQGGVYRLAEKVIKNYREIKK